MAASTTPKPKTTPIPGSIAFNTTGYPAPTSPPPAPDTKPAAPQVEILMVKPPCAQNSYTVYPSRAMLEFSIADLRHLGKVTDIRDLVVEMIFINPATAKTEKPKLEIASPEREQLYFADLVSEGCIQRGCHTVHTFSLNLEHAHKVDRLFVPGNRFIVHAKVLEEIEEGKLQVAVRKYC
jgi:hypothetical protein